MADGMKRERRVKRGRIKKNIDARIARRAAKSAERLISDQALAGAGDTAIKSAGLMAGVAGLAAVGTVAGVSAARARRYRGMIEDAYRGEDFALLDADRGCVVTTADGVPLIVREVGPVTAPLTVVFRAWVLFADGCSTFSARAPAERWGNQVRMVFWTNAVMGSPVLHPSTLTPCRSLGAIWNPLCGW